MRTLRFASFLAVLAAALLVAPAGSAAPCAGFTDVEDTSQFCANVQWLRNREITLGCTGLAAYCPNDPVIRLSMAAFLQRLGTALIPTTLGEIDLPGGGAVTLANTPVVCAGASNRFLARGFPRTTRGHATFVFRSSGSSDVSIELVESTDNGATWTTASPAHAVSAADQQWATLAVLLPPRLMNPGDSHEYGLRIARRAGSASVGNPSQYFCRYKLYADNRNPSTPPLDE
jgi:hypothetical protein